MNPNKARSWTRAEVFSGIICLIQFVQNIELLLWGDYDGIPPVIVCRIC